MFQISQQTEEPILIPKVPLEWDNLILDEKEVEIALEVAKNVKISALRNKLKFTIVKASDEDLEKLANEYIENERENIIRQANYDKHSDLAHEKYKERVKAEKDAENKAFRKQWDKNRFYKLLCSEFQKRNNKPFDFNILNGAQKNYIKHLILFMACDTDFEQKYSFKKGLLVVGNYGVGKTESVKCVANNQITPIEIHSMVEIKKQISEHGKYSIKLPVSNQNKVLLDDVGVEGEISYYGNKITWFKDFILDMYHSTKNYNRLILTTNLSVDRMTEVYGQIVSDRVREMFNVIEVGGESFRK